MSNRYLVHVQTKYELVVTAHKRQLSPLFFSLSKFCIFLRCTSSRSWMLSSKPTFSCWIVHFACSNNHRLPMWKLCSYLNMQTYDGLSPILWEFNNNNNSTRKCWHLQFHNCELYFQTRPPNMCSHRRCERDFVLNCFTVTPEHIRLYFLVFFLFLHFLVVGSVW